MTDDTIPQAKRPVKCKWCGETIPNFREMSKHNWDKHAAELKAAMKEGYAKKARQEAATQPTQAAQQLQVHVTGSGEAPKAPDGSEHVKRTEIDTRALAYYDFAKSKGFNGNLSDFLNAMVVERMKEKGIDLAVVESLTDGTQRSFLAGMGPGGKDPKAAKLDELLDSFTDPRHQFLAMEIENKKLELERKRQEMARAQGNPGQAGSAGAPQAPPQQKKSYRLEDGTTVEVTPEDWLQYNIQMQRIAASAQRENEDKVDFPIRQPDGSLQIVKIKSEHIPLVMAATQTRPPVEAAKPTQDLAALLQAQATQFQLQMTQTQAANDKALAEMRHAQEMRAKEESARFEQQNREFQLKLNSMHNDQQMKKMEEEIAQTRALANQDPLSRFQQERDRLKAMGFVSAEDAGRADVTTRAQLAQIEQDVKKTGAGVDLAIKKSDSLERKVDKGFDTGLDLIKQNFQLQQRARLGNPPPVEHMELAAPAAEAPQVPPPPGAYQFPPPPAVQAQVEIYPAAGLAPPLPLPPGAPGSANGPGRPMTS